MKKKKVILYFVTVIMLLSMTVGVALAEDGILFRQQHIQDTRRRNGKSSHLYDGLLCSGTGIYWACWTY